MTGPSICLKTNQSNEKSLKNTSKKQQLVTSSIYILPNGAVKVDTGKKNSSEKTIVMDISRTEHIGCWTWAILTP